LCLLIPLHVSASRCHLQGVTISLFISYSSLSHPKCHHMSKYTSWSLLLVVAEV
jgi:hypothetical protein